MQLTPFLQNWPPMIPASLSFIYVFLPVALFVYYIFPQRSRPGVMVAITAAYYALTQPQGLFLMAVSVLLDFAAVRVMARYDENEFMRRSCMWFSLVKNISIIVYTGAIVQIRTAPMLLGCTIYTLSALDAMAGFYKREVPYENNPVSFALYCTFFPKLYAGPLQPYGEFSPQLAEIHLNPRGILIGAGQFVQGALKNAVFGKQLTALYLSVKAFPLSETTVLSTWVLVFSIALAVYYTLSGFCDMAQGLGLMFGLFLPKNFYYPYQSRSVGDFFERFNMTLSSFIRRTIYTFLQGDRGGRATDSLNLIVYGMLMGLWFGLRINYLIWGVYMALFWIMERYVYKGVLERIPVLFSRVYTLCVVLSGFTIMAGDDLKQSTGYIFNMFRFRSDLIEMWNDKILYLMSSHWLLLLLSAFFATNCINAFMYWFRREVPIAAEIVFGALNVVVLIGLTAMLI